MDQEEENELFKIILNRVVSGPTRRRNVAGFSYFWCGAMIGRGAGRASGRSQYCFSEIKRRNGGGQCC